MIRALLAVLVSVPATALADSWPGPAATAVVSENGEFLVRLIPGASIGDTYGFAGARKGEYASAQWFRFRGTGYEPLQTIRLTNPVAPIKAVVANDGTLVTFDNWHNVGYGDVVAIYAADGKLRKKYRLDDLYPLASRQRIRTSVSSIWWRCMNPAPLLGRDGKLEVDDTLGGRFTFRLGDGAQSYDAGGGGECKE